MRTKWCGPAVVTAVSSSWVYTVKNLITQDERVAHATRLKFYADKDLHVTSDFLAQVAHNSEGFEVETLEDVRYVSATQSYEILVKWRGLQAVENSWEPASVLFEDVTVIFKRFCRSSAIPLVKELKKVYDI